MSKKYITKKFNDLLLSFMSSNKKKLGIPKRPTKKELNTKFKINKDKKGWIIHQTKPK